MRAAALALALAEVAAMRAAPGAAAAAPIVHIDWGAASGAFARALGSAAAAADGAADGVAADGPAARPVRSRSFDILPAGEGVEFADMASPPADWWGVAEGGADLMSGIANLTNGRDLPGFYRCCARLLRRGGGVLLLVQARSRPPPGLPRSRPASPPDRPSRCALVQPLNFVGAALALRGVGEVEGLFATRPRSPAISRDLPRSPPSAPRVPVLRLPPIANLSLSCHHHQDDALPRPARA